MEERVREVPSETTEHETRALAEEHGTVGDLAHPRGTLAIVLLYGLLFGLGWLAFYFFGFLPRGAPHP